MTLQEFKAWFEGFSENMGDNRPTEKQWKRICEKIKTIDGTVTPYPVFIEKWQPYWSQPWYPYITWCSSHSSSNPLQGSFQGMQSNNQLVGQGNCLNLSYQDLGRAEYQELANG